MSANPSRPAVASTPRSTRQWSIGEKLRVLAAAHGTDNAALGELLRREGCHDADLALWRHELADVLTAQRLTASKMAGELAALTAKLAASERELREVKALLELKKKVDAMFGAADADGVTHRRNDKPSSR